MIPGQFPRETGYPIFREFPGNGSGKSRERTLAMTHVYGWKYRVLAIVQRRGARFVKETEVSEFWVIHGERGYQLLDWREITLCAICFHLIWACETGKRSQITQTPPQLRPNSN
jgi:hypothetical protein